LIISRLPFSKNPAGIVIPFFILAIALTTVGIINTLVLVLLNNKKQKRVDGTLKTKTKTSTMAQDTKTEKSKEKSKSSISQQSKEKSKSSISLSDK